MSDVIIRTEGRAGRITLNRPAALNALTWDMLRAFEGAITAWRTDPQVQIVLIDAEGRAFCAGGDIAEMYATGRRGDADYGRAFWRDEYRLNAALHHYPKPVVSFLQGYTMGGGVGIGCHARHRIVGETSRIAMPECGIGLVPDVGGSLLLARAPGRLGEYLGLTGDRMEAGDAILAGFADHFVPEADWPALAAAMAASGQPALPDHAAPPARLADWQPDIDRAFAAPTLADIRFDDSPALAHAEKLMRRNSPLSMAAALDIIRAARADPRIETALDHEFRFTFRAVAHSDFIEGIRAAIIDKDRNPRWRHAGWNLPADDIAAMTAPLGPDSLNLTETPS
ncbi:MAG: enoyl-CoA hydratase/isomerase family protein [Limimaricola sp.]|uniref:enoyl-CoA hydratase/isomerase family protein n=1 Tax=Limimaricola sp. TaxID=2211665 RepID=UPI001D3703CF|nr:enoyl-CoA hydratase/isomerase family protein [Limimaricola sp.]MBI1418389.1 enoyl-CoA hydratase/isomerase family protein [Limimaricola sp.]